MVSTFPGLHYLPGNLNVDDWPVVAPICLLAFLEGTGNIWHLPVIELYNHLHGQKRPLRLSDPMVNPALPSHL